MARSIDVVVAGLGAMGSAALYHLARRGVRVVGLDRYSPPHSLGSTHGLSRIIREAYYEHPLYVPLVQRAYELWAELESLSGRSLFRQTGGLMIGPRDGTLVAGARRSAREHALTFDELTADEARARFPAFAIPDGMSALHEPRAGVLDPEGGVAAHLELARASGADVRADEPVVRWHAERGRVRVVTAGGEYEAPRLALCTGAWTPSLVADLPVLLNVERQVMHWFTPARRAERFSPDHCPIAMIEYAPERLFYILPDSGDGVKAAIHHEGILTNPEQVSRQIGRDEVDRVRELLRQYLPDAAGTLRRSATCLYTNTTDHHFLVDFHPRQAEVLIVSACSGHGFKFASAIGELAADLLSGVAPTFDLRPFACASR